MGGPAGASSVQGKTARRLQPSGEAIAGQDFRLLHVQLTASRAWSCISNLPRSSLAQALFPHLQQERCGPGEHTPGFRLPTEHPGVGHTSKGAASHAARGRGQARRSLVGHQEPALAMDAPDYLASWFLRTKACEYRPSLFCR